MHVGLKVDEQVTVTLPAKPMLLMTNPVLVLEPAVTVAGVVGTVSEMLAAGAMTVKLARAKLAAGTPAPLVESVSV